MDTALAQFNPPDGWAAGRQNRAETEQRRVIRHQVRLRGFAADGAIALGSHIMEGMVDLDDYRKELAGDDVDRNLLLGELEATCVRQVKHIQASLFATWEV